MIKIKKDKYQVYLLSSPISIPLPFALHTYFVSISKGKIQRWDVFHRYELKKPCWGYLHLNAHNLEKGISVIPYFEIGPRWNSKIISYIEGNENSLASSLTRYDTLLSILNYYRYHLENLSEIKSLKVLHKIFH